MNEQTQGDSALPLPRLMTWEEEERCLAGQSNLPGVAKLPTLAERIFLRLSRQWADEYAIVPAYHPPPQRVDEMALTCLLLAAGWGQEFTEVAMRQIEDNRNQTQLGGVLRWEDQLIWELALAAKDLCPAESAAIGRLAANLDHHNSSLRGFMLEIGWMVKKWLPRDAVAPILLKNVADTLIWVDEAFGLARALFDSDKELDRFIEKYVPPERFESQFADRVKDIRDRGFMRTQAYFWHLETRCRAGIEQAVLGWRMRPGLTEHMTRT